MTTETPTKITGHIALNSLRRVVQNVGGEHRVKECTYWVLDDDGNRVPNCIVGHVFVDLGYDLDELFDGQDGYNACGFTSKEFSEKMSLNTTRNARMILGTAQRVQDSYDPANPGLNKTWGEALREAANLYYLLQDSK